MSRSSLPRYRFARTSAEGGGGGTNPPAGDQSGAGDGAAKTDPPKNTGPVEATDPETGIGLGFPAETKVDDMTDAQKAAYWRNHSKKMQKQVPSNLAELQENARKWAEFQQSQQTPAEQQIQKARDEAAAATRKEVAAESALTNLRVVLHTRGKSEAEVEGLVEFLNPERFLTQDGKVDTARVIAYADGIAPAGSGGGSQRGGLPGQGKFGQASEDKSAAGKAEADRRFSRTKAGGTSSLLPQNS